MNAIKRKIADSSGSSIFLAMLMFFMCLTVGGVVLAAAMTNAGKHALAREREQAYLTVGSAARMILAQIDNDSASLLKRIVENENNSGETVGSSEITVSEEGLFKDITGEFTRTVFPLRYPSDDSFALAAENTVMPSLLPERTIYVTASEEPELDGVTAVFSMDAGFNITVRLCITPPEDGSDYEDCVMIVRVPATLTQGAQSLSETDYPIASGEKDEAGDDIMTLYTVRERSMRVDIIWGAGAVERGEVQ